jgi:hypothetical protein
MKRKVKYPEAVTVDGNRVIAKVIGLCPNEWKGQKFYIPGCEGSVVDEMVFAKRKHRRGVTYFFRHKAQGVDKRKAQDKYLHNLAEIILKERFDKSKSSGEFFVKYYVKSGCTLYDKCDLKKDFNCGNVTKAIQKTLNLRELYDTCTLEKREDGFIADLLLTNSKDNSVKPMFLEVLVTHECSDKKKNSGNQIIELTIKKPEDAENEIVENEGDLIDEFCFMSIENAPKTPPIRFYGFKKIEECSIYKTYGNFSLFEDSGNYFGICRKCSCRDLKEMVTEKTALSISIPIEEIDSLDLYELGMAISYKDGFSLRDCSLCCYYRIPSRNGKGIDIRSCRLPNSVLNYKDGNGNGQKLFKPYVFQLPSHCNGFDKSYQAQNCKDFLIDNRRIEALVKKIVKLNCCIEYNCSVLPNKKT